MHTLKCGFRNNTHFLIEVTHIMKNVENLEQEGNKQPAELPFYHPEIIT